MCRKEIGQVIQKVKTLTPFGIGKESVEEQLETYLQPTVEEFNTLEGQEIDRVIEERKKTFRANSGFDQYFTYLAQERTRRLQRRTTLRDHEQAQNKRHS